jgi:hypothetical protein
MPNVCNQTDLIERLRHLSSRRITAEFRNALKEAADALQTARNDALEEAAKVLDGNADVSITPMVQLILRSNAEAIRAMKEKK